MAAHTTDPARKPRGLLSTMAIVFGALAVGAGLWLVGAYVFGAIIDRIGEPDQSLAFWHLPLVFIGVATMGLGGAAIAFGIHWRRRGSF
ncbi:MAG: hypothetical protein JXR33_03500 [Coriobacteriia bacterium]|nr:hypothetical protein [Coriobacteriia bacterium]